MGRTYDGIDERQREWIARQPLFFVGSAPLDGDGHVNVSPKGPIGSLRVLDERTGGVPRRRRQRRGDDRAPARERAHRRDAVRVRRAAADPAPARPRRGRAAAPRRASSGCSSRPASSSPPSPSRAARSIVVHVTRVADSCGYGVPLMSYEGERPHQAGLVGEARPRRTARRLRGLPARAERREHRRPPGRRARVAALARRSMSSAWATRGRPSTSQVTSTWSFLR